MSDENVIESSDAIESNESEGLSADSSNVESESLEEQVEQALENGASKKEVQNMIKKYQLKVNGKEVTKEIDLNDEEAVKRELQKAYAFSQTAAEANEMKKLMNDYMTKLKNDPYAALEELGLDPDDIAEKRLQQRIEELKKSPEQIAFEKLTKERDNAMAKLREQEEKAQALEMQKLQTEIEKSLNEDITKALDAHKDLPATEYTIKKIADTLVWAMDNGYEDVRVDDIMPIVKKEIKADIQKLLNGVPEEFLDEYISSQISEKQRKRKLSQVKQVNNISNLTKTVSKEPAKTEATKKISIDDWMRR